MKPVKASSESSYEQHILVAVMGLSPAVLTETLYALSTESEPDLPDRIIVITTTQGHDRVRQVLFDRGAWTALTQALEQKLGPEALHGKLRFGPVGDCLRVIPKHQLDGDLEDILTSDDNRAVADFMLAQLAGLCSQDHFRITASIAGGRKTMGALLLSALSMVGRPQDRAVHILVNDPWDRIPDFFFPGCPGHFRCPNSGQSLRSSDAQLALADVPFVPLRPLFASEFNVTPSDLYRLADRLTFSPSLQDDSLNILIDTASGSITIGDKTLKPSPMEFALIGTLAHLAKEQAPTPAQYLDLQVPLLAFVKQHTDPQDFGHWSHSILEAPHDPKDAYRKAASSLRTKLRTLGIPSFESQRLLPARGSIRMRLKPENIQIL